MTDLNHLTRFTDGSIAGRQARLPGRLRDLHRAVLRRFLETGAAPTARWVRQAATELGLDANAADELDAADAVHITNGVVRHTAGRNGLTGQRQAPDPDAQAALSMDELAEAIRRSHAGPRPGRGTARHRRVPRGARPPDRVSLSPGRAGPLTARPRGHPGFPYLRARTRPDTWVRGLRLTSAMIREVT
jgi:hypothetical protein